VGRGDAVVDDGGEVEGDVVLGHADLLGDLCWVYVSETGSTTVAIDAAYQQSGS
jgi:hypothetical protein